VRDPKVFLFDEPLSNLDASLRLNMRVELSKLHKELKTTMLYVTHDQVEAMTLADRIVVFNGGHIQQVGTPLEMYEYPTNIFVAGFLGSPKMNLFKGQVAQIENTLATIELHNKAQAQAAVLAEGAKPGDSVTLGIRPEHIQLTNKDNSGALQARVQLVENLGDTVLVYAETEASKHIICIKLPSDSKGIKAGDSVGISMPAKNCLLFDAEGNAFPRQRG
jgi:multiple sugar transport system ATP-binding protein